MTQKYLETEFTPVRQAVARVYQELDEILVRLTRIERTNMRSAAEEFHKAYPASSVAPELIALVGVQPVTTIEEDKTDLRDLLARKFE